MFSDQYGSLTTTFIRNEVNFLVYRHDFYYLSGEATRPVPPPGEHIELPFRTNRLVERIRWGLWKRDLVCSFRNRGYSSRLSNIIDEVDPDIIHCQFGYEALKLLQNLPASIKVPIIVHFHGYDASEMLLKSSYVNAYRSILQNNKRISIITVSSYMMHRLNSAGIRSKYRFVLRCGIDIEKFSLGVKGPSGPKVFLQVSSLSEKKGHEITLRAIKCLAENDPEYFGRVKFVFTGGGIRRQVLQQLARDYGIEQIVEFIGDRSTEEVAGLLHEADYFLHPSITAKNGDQEGIPTAIMEAMAVGLPIVSTKHAGIPELVEHGVNGLLSNEKDVEGLARGICMIFLVGMC